jgi:hypothetical protein
LLSIWSVEHVAESMKEESRYHQPTAVAKCADAIQFGQRPNLPFAAYWTSRLPTSPSLRTKILSGSFSKRRRRRRMSWKERRI